MNNRLLGIHIPADIHAAAHTSATLNGVTLKEWLLPIIVQNLHPDAAALFLPGDALTKEQKRSKKRSA
jgi:hypothetical protein